MFRRLSKQLNWFWAVGSLLVGVTVTVIVYVVDNLDVVFALGWCLPWVWGAVGALVTVLWVKRMLRVERETWGEGRV